MTPHQPGTPSLFLAEAFAAHALAWARERGSTNRDALTGLDFLARRLSLAVSEGHVCLLLDEAEKESGLSAERLRDILLNSGLVGIPGRQSNFPMVLDGENRLYLHRYFACEQALAERLLSFREPTVTDANAIRLSLEHFFGSPNPAAADWQRLAAALAMRQRLTVISGGPGTGKTTTIANILACLLTQNPDNRIVLAAPTGKAAMRMLESIRTQTARFPAVLHKSMPTEAFTLHRLLGMTARPGIFRHHAKNPLALDTLIVDEASMIDLALALRLFDALPSHARLIMLGDKDQLCAVEVGAVFPELSANPALSPACISDLAAMTGIDRTAISPPAGSSLPGLADSAVWLTQNFRFEAESGIGALALAIRDGRAADARKILLQSPDGSLGWLPGTATGQLEESAASGLYEGYAHYLQTVTSCPNDRQAVFDAFDRFRVLCAVHESTLGVSAINAKMTAHFTQALAVPQKDWFIGRPVMILRNDYALRLFNGDIGIALPDETRTLMVYFPTNTGEFRAISPSRLPEHETAFAMTIHKSQGSEFESLLILLPSRSNPVLTRELLYTAVTRARKKVCLVCSGEILESSILVSVRKHSGLLSRIREAGE